MINRRFLRVKVLQAVYAYQESGEDFVENGIKHLIDSIEKLRDLFVWQISFLVETKRFAENRIEENKHKNFPTADDLNPNMRYVENRVLVALENNKDLRKEEERLKINWADHQDIVRGYYNKMRETEEYKQYMSDSVDNFDHDKKFIVKMINEYFADLEVLQDFYEEKSIFFVDDYHLVSSMLVKFFTEMKANFNENTSLPSIYKTGNDPVNEDKEFVKNLFRKVLLHDSEYGKMVGENTSNWEKERVCIMDMIILKLAITEFCCFPYIPVKVTMNEYIEISKYFSTPKSKIFVNGILDRILKKLNDQGAVVKKGIGLLDS
ncbi:MAG: transcription antitermination protein NusB [Bacteroidales bacterium]|nr:transcription antitermination protein NusB [Lentimicrobiaceae bacterium]MBQ3594109.1 transcription antitermination protein NusB [Bacteroidales bacterium]